jgi:hypothetical protein
MQPSIDRPTGSRAPALRRYGPIAVLVAIIAVVAIVVATSGGSSGKKPLSSSSTTAVSAAPAGSPSPTGALSFSQAKAEGKQIAWPPSCDTATGRIAMPDPFAPECYAPAADNGGATANGVTGSTINVVLYTPEPNDPVLNFIEGAIAVTDTQAQTEATYRGYVKIFEHFYNTYGRKVNLEVLHASGLSTDEVAARADAVKAATELNAFAVWGGPVLTTAWADELAARHVICLGCSGGSTPDWFAQRPYVFPITTLAKQGEAETIEYLTKQVTGRPASHAGDPALAAKTRKLGLLYILTDANTQALANDFASQMAAKGEPLAISVPYTLDPARLQEEAAGAIAKLKSAGVTSVLFSGDPVAPATFTKEATAQNYFPEWILTGSALVDTTVFARTYDQKQWAHAFGISQLTARTEPQLSPSYSLYQWALGIPPPAADTNGVLYPQPALFYAALQTAGPHLTTDNFRLGLFSIAPGRSALTTPVISYGNHGIWPYTDYNGIDDATEVWWDTKAIGPDEIRRNGTGMYQYVDGGKRYLPGQWPTTDSKAFDPAGAVTIYTTPPPGEAPKSYPPPTGL